MNTKTLQDSTGRTWQEVRSHTYSLAEIVDYLKECQAPPQNDTEVYFTILDSGELTITTGIEYSAGMIEGRGFTVLRKRG